MTTSQPSSAPQDVDTAATPALGVLLITYQSEDDLPGLLASLGPAVAPFDYEVVVVDNASRDRSAAIGHEAGARVVVNDTNTGLSRAINQAAALTAAPWLLVVNPDTRLDLGSIARLIETARDDEAIGCVGPRIVTPEGRDYPTGRRFPSPGVGVVHAVVGRVWPGNPATKAYFGDPLRGDVDWVSGSCMLFRRTAFDAIGGFDTGYFMYFEETDACLRLHRLGWRVVYEPDVAITHREGGSTRFEPFNKIYNHHRSALRFYCRQHRRDGWIIFAPLVAVGLILRATASVAATTLARARRS